MTPVPSPSKVSWKRWQNGWWSQLHDLSYFSFSLSLYFLAKHSELSNIKDAAMLTHLHLSCGGSVCSVAESPERDLSVPLPNIHRSWQWVHKKDSSVGKEVAVTRQT